MELLLRIMQEFTELCRVSGLETPLSQVVPMVQNLNTASLHQMYVYDRYKYLSQHTLPWHGSFELSPSRDL